MGASYRPAYPATGPASWPADARRQYRGGIGHNGGPTWDADAAHYIDRTGALFPAAVNDLVVGIKALGLWDDHVGSIKLAVGAPSLAASVLDLRNPAFDGTAVNAPAHSATAGWSFTAASTHYIDSGWNPSLTGSKASQNSVHVGARMREGTSGGNHAFYARADFGSIELGLSVITTGLQRAKLQDNTNTAATEATGAPGHYIAARTAADACALYKNGASIATSAVTSIGLQANRLFIGARNLNGAPDNFTTTRISVVHAGAGLTATEAAELVELFASYGSAVGEA